MDKVLKDLQEALNIISSGKFRKNDVLAFMVKLRASNKLDPILRDLCDFFAHPKRNKGESFEFIESFLQKFIKACEVNSSVVIPTPFFNKKEVIENILLHLSNLRLSINHSSFMNSSDEFINYLLESIDGIEYKSLNPKVKCCHIKYKENEKPEAFFCFQLQDIDKNAIVRRDGPGKTCLSIFYDGNKKLSSSEVIMK